MYKKGPKNTLRKGGILRKVADFAKKDIRRIGDIDDQLKKVSRPVQDLFEKLLGTAGDLDSGVRTIQEHSKNFSQQ